MLNITIFCSGALIMILEMVGGRVLAPHVGTSAVVWTSIIGIVLAFLALGAWAGGKYADKKLSLRGLSFVLLLAGFGTAITAAFHTAIGQGASSSFSSIYEAAVVAAAGIFALPAFFFGMITPYIIRLSLAGLANAGATVGRLYALSTAGSILGTFLGGFILISWVSSTTILWGAAACMALLALCNCRDKPLFKAGVAALFIFFAVRAEYNSGSFAAEGIKTVESPYNVVQIMEAKDYRRGNAPVKLMATDPGYSQSGMLISEPDALYFDYTRFYSLGPAWKPDAKKILMLGGGGYSVPKWLMGGKSALDAPENLQLTVVELDPAMTRIACEEFGLKDDPRMHIIHEDARSFLNRQDEKYDLIFMDVFNSHYSIPFHVGTRQAMRRLAQALAPDGILLMNVISAITGQDGRLFRAIYGAMREYFPEIRVYAVSHPGKPDQAQNLMIAASFRPAPELQTRSTNIDPGYDEIKKMSAHIYDGPIESDAPPLDDDFAPVDRYALMLARQ